MMFIKVRKNKCPTLLHLNEIYTVEPFDGGGKVSIKTKDGDWFFWDGDLDAFQEALIDNAAQVTAPIASRVMGLDNTIARLARSVEDLLEKFSTPIVNLDNMTPEEREAFQDNLVAARRALRTIDKGTTIQPSGQVGIESDVLALIRLLKDREYAEHWATSALGADLEEEITKLVGHDNATASRLQRAEELLAEVWHEWNNDDATRKALGEDMGKVIGNFIYPDRTKS
ncbi:hypothetical protein [Phage ST231]|nr:hypothetical protein [Phage ST231]